MTKAEAIAQALTHGATLQRTSPAPAAGVVCVWSYSSALPVFEGGLVAKGYYCLIVKKGGEDYLCRTDTHPTMVEAYDHAKRILAALTAAQHPQAGGDVLCEDEGCPQHGIKHICNPLKERSAGSGERERLARAFYEDEMAPFGDNGVIPFDGLLPEYQPTVDRLYRQADVALKALAATPAPQPEPVQNLHDIVSTADAAPEGGEV
jgi:hypothetical protein